jgi:hypothetical protein
VRSAPRKWAAQQAFFGAATFILAIKTRHGTIGLWAMLG